jgi:beta-phosphoglucomutase
MGAAGAGLEALVFDFNGTLSDDEPLMYEIYRRLFAEKGRPVTRAQYFEELAGHSEEAIIGGWLGVEGDELDALVAERVARYNAAAADG